MLQLEYFLHLLYKMKGGNSYSSASSYGSYVNGNGNAQFSRVFDKGGQYGNIPGNAMIGAQGQKAGRRRRTRRKRGGNLIPIISQAVVPLSVLGMQQSYKPGTISRLSNFNRGNNFNRGFSRKYPSSRRNRSKRSFR